MNDRDPVGSTARESGADASQVEWRPSLLLYHLFILAALLVPSVGVLTYVGFELRDRYRASVDRRLETTAQSLSVAIERAFQRHVGALESLGSLPGFGSAVRDGDLGGLYLHASRSADLLGTNIVLIRPDMSQVFNTLAPLDADLPKTGGVEVARRTFEVGTPQMSNLVFGRVANRYAVGLSVPVRDVSGKVATVVAAPLDPGLLADVLAVGMQAQDGTAALIDANGKIIARSERHEDFVGEDVLDWWRKATRGRERGHAVGPDLQGRDVLVSYVPVTGASNWTLAVTLPVSLYEAYWRKPLVILLAGIAAAILLGVGLSLILARRIQKPLTALAGFALERASAIKSGTLPEGRVSSGPDAPVREIHQLRDSLAIFETEVVRRDREQLDLVARLEAALGDRDVLLGEIYHRVKNNLQQIIALTALRSSTSRTSEAREALAFISNRVQALAKVHQMLLQMREPSRLDPREFLESLCDTIAMAYDLGARNVRITVDADAEADGLSPDTAITLGLIVTELVENAQRHAFVGRETGEIRVRYGRHRNGRLHLTVADDGIGGLGEAESGTGLGNSIVAALAGQLSGEVATESGDAGTAVTVLFDTDAGEEM